MIMITVSTAGQFILGNILCRLYNIDIEMRVFMDIHSISQALKLVSDYDTAQNSDKKFLFTEAMEYVN